MGLQRPIIGAEGVIDGVPAKEYYLAQILDPTKGAAFYNVSIAQGAPGTTHLTAALTIPAGQVARIHEIVGTMDVSGTFTIKHDSDGAGGGTPVALYGLGTVTSVNIPYRKDPHGCLNGLADRKLTITTTTGKFSGRAVVSIGPDVA